MSQPRCGGNAKKAQESMVTVPTLSIPSAVSFSVHGMIGSLSLQLLVDTGAAVSLLNASIWKEINSTETHIVSQKWTWKKLVGVNGTPLSVKECVHVPALIGGGGGVLSSKGPLQSWRIRWLMLFWRWTFSEAQLCYCFREKKLLRF